MRELIKEWTAPLPRIERPELLDLGEGTADEVRENLRDMHWLNRWLGGHAALRRFLLPRIRRAVNGRPLRILDVASGAAHTPVRLANWARRRGIPVRIVALDANSLLLGMAREKLRLYPEISRLSADARDLPFEPGAFDFVISTQFLHHLTPGALPPMLRALAHISRGPVILNDLVRSTASTFLFRHGAPLLFRNRLTLHDGLASIGQAYTTGEMREMLDTAGLARARIYSHAVYCRMTVVIDPAGGSRPV